MSGIGITNLLANYSASYVPKTSEQLSLSTGLDSPPEDEIINGMRISAEAQYMFEVDQYLSSLSEAEQNQALDYMTASDDRLMQESANNFKENRESRITFANMEEVQALIAESTAKSQKMSEDILNNPTPTITVHPPATQIFRLDDDEEFDAIRFSISNSALNDQLDSLETVALAEMDKQDTISLVGSVRNAIGVSENPFKSIDDVVHFNYTLEKAQRTIDYLDVPEELASDLKQLLEQTIPYQQNQQNKFLSDTSQYLSDDRLSRTAGTELQAGLLRGTAAKELNEKLQSKLVGSNASILDAADLIQGLVSQYGELGSPSPEKIDEMLRFYEKDFIDHQRLLDKDFAIQPKRLEFDAEILDAGHNLALKVIEEINSYFV